MTDTTHLEPRSRAGSRTPSLPRRAALAAASLVALYAMQPLASTLLALDLPTLSRRADEVVVARVVSAQAEPARGTIVTRYVLEVEVAVAGRSRPADQLDVIVPGGELNGVGVLVHGAPRLAPRGRYLLFLRERAGQRVVLGLAQGALPVRESPSTGELVVEPSPELPRLVRQGPVGLQPAAAAVQRPTPLQVVTDQIREARDGR